MKDLYLLYLRTLAKLQLLKFRPLIIGVGGATGKSSLSNFISIILRDKYKVLESGGKNSQTGIPLRILGIKREEYNFWFWFKALFLALGSVIFSWEKFDIYVAEMGIDGPRQPRNMEYLLKIVRPEVGVLTNVAFEHSQYFGDKEEEIFKLTKEQELLLLKSVPQEGFAVINFDDPNIKNLKKLKAQILTVSAKDKNADFFVENIKTTLSKFKLNFFYEHKSYQLLIEQPLPKHYAISFLLAIAVSTRFGFSISEAVKILRKNFSLPPGRISIFRGKRGTTIIDSTYNNVTPESLLDLLDMLKDISSQRRKVAIIGDMRELGVMSKKLHEKVAKKLLDTTDLVILIGHMTSEFVAPVLEKGNHNFRSFQTFTEAKKLISSLIKNKDVILVKGSQNKLYLERVVEMLLTNKKDISKLARRGKFWDKKRRETL